LFFVTTPSEGRFVRWTSVRFEYLNQNDPLRWGSRRDPPALRSRVRV